MSAVLRGVCIGLAALLHAASAGAALPNGAPAPQFEAPAALDGAAIRYSLAEALRKGPVVVYFYPSAYTGGCNLQAHTFATRLAEFNAAGATVVGVSLDSLERLRDFSADPDYCAGRLPVVSDGDGEIARSFAVGVRAAQPGRLDTRGMEIDHGFSERTTFVIATDGRIVQAIEGLAPVKNVDAALQAVETLARGARSSP